MVNPHYAKGRQYEFERVREHRNRGALVAVRTAGSHSPWDVLALYENRVVLEQCKRVTVPLIPERLEQERKLLSCLQVPPGVETYLVIRSDFGATKAYPIHPPVKKDVPPSEPMSEQTPLAPTLSP